ncbi:MAG: prolipoprotein diacylglyceryl transferase [Tannerellaceae bacterium]|jgi:prolipoprotein diacylglyceryl transferase|nr:prolipoprotein diacylglyceryl transferase [Tannerellaceae bacterium]
MLNFITWTADPALFQVGTIEVRWYGLAFAVGFYIGDLIAVQMWKKEKLNREWIYPLFWYTILGTVLGARLGHCLFYQPSLLTDPLAFINIRGGGLASHGGVLGIIIAIYFFSRKYTHKSMLWTFDRLVVPTGLVAALIRLGNLMNHEIYGHATDVPWAFKFIQNIYSWKQGQEPIFSPPSHPTQIYEAACYMLTFVLCMWLYFKKDAYKREGFIFGIFMICIFASRFFIEYLKNVQEDFEVGMILKMGQLLSLPFILAGVYFVWRALKKQPQQYESKRNSK